VAKILFKCQIAHRFDVVMSALASAGMVAAAWILWGAVYAGQAEVGGFSRDAMLAYYLAASFLASLERSSDVMFETNDRIRGGTFSKFMVLPADLRLYTLAQTVGETGYIALFSLPVVALTALLLGIRPQFAPDLTRLLGGAAMAGLGIVFMNAFAYVVGLMAFTFGDVGFFIHLQGNVIQFATGAMVPLALLPGGVLAALKLLPFPYVNYMPAMLITGLAEPGELWRGLAVLGAWTAGMLWLGKALYGRFRVLYDGVGI
jgi:ABC-2 type transport system permease protein